MNHQGEGVPSPPDGRFRGGKELSGRGSLPPSPGARRIICDCIEGTPLTLPGRQTDLARCVQAASCGVCEPAPYISQSNLPYIIYHRATCLIYHRCCTTHNNLAKYAVWADQSDADRCLLSSRARDRCGVRDRFSTVSTTVHHTLNAVVCVKSVIMLQHDHRSRSLCNRIYYGARTVACTSERSAFAPIRDTATCPRTVDGKGASALCERERYTRKTRFSPPFT